MPDSKPSPAAPQLVPTQIRSVEQLEILLLLGRSKAMVWTAKSVYEAILTTPRSVQMWLDDLVLAGFAEKVTSPAAGYRFTADEQKAAAIDALAEAYHTTPVRIIEAVYHSDPAAPGPA